MTTTRFYEEHDLLPGTRVPLDPEAEHAYEAKVAEAIEAELDHAVGRGALRSAERDRWRDRLRREPDLATEILRDLPPNPDVADRNFAEDPRLRRLGKRVRRVHGGARGGARDPLLARRRPQSERARLQDALECAQARGRPMTVTLEERTAEVAAEIQTLQAELAEAEREAEERFRELAGDVVLHVVTEVEGAKRRAAIERELNARRERIGLLQQAIPEIEQRRLAEEEKVRQGELRTARKKVGDAVSSRDRAVKNLRDALKALVLAAAELERHRGGRSSRTCSTSSRRGRCGRSPMPAYST